MASSKNDITTMHVIDMFKNINLPVTDDDHQIIENINKLEAFYNRQKNSPDPRASANADLWFKNRTKIERDRDTLLKVVRDNFFQQADTLLEAAISSGLDQLTPQIYSNLERYALEQCKCDAPLARQLVEQYLKKRNYKIKGTLVFPHLIEQLSAFSSDNGIELRWKLPNTDCDEVVIKRSEGMNISSNIRELTRGKLSHYVDRDVQPGEKYRYEIFSVHRGIESQTSVSIETTAVGELSEVKKQWIENHVRLTWKKPAEYCRTVIFRSPTPIRGISGNTPEPMPDNSDAESVYQGPDSQWDDHDVSPGTNYYYLLVAFFESGLYSSGKQIALRTPVPPPAVISASAHYVNNGVNIQWKRLHTREQPEYAVICREGTVPPTEIRDGRFVGITRSDHILDKKVSPGQCYSYTVFSRLRQLYSLRGCHTPPVDILADVTDLTTENGDGTVDLNWKTPANTLQVIVCRNIHPPNDHTDGHTVNLTGGNTAKDENLVNGETYHYLVCCSYRPDGRTERFSPGVRIRAIPSQPPDVIKDFKVQVDYQEVVCSWSPPCYGQGVVVKSDRSPSLTLGKYMKMDEIDHLGERVTTERGYARDLSPNIRKPYYSLFSVAGSQSVYCGSGVGVFCRDVTNLKLAATKDGVILRWDWPDESDCVKIVRCRDDWPQGSEDPNAVFFNCTRSDYKAAGEKFTDSIEEGSRHYFYVVYAQIRGRYDLFCSPGTDPLCRADIQWSPWMTLQYEIVEPTESNERGSSFILKWCVENPYSGFSGFVLVADQNGPPQDIAKGLTIFRWTPEEKLETNYERNVSIEPIKQRQWPWFYVKMFVFDPAQRYTVQIVHPNTCNLIDRTGKAQTNKTDDHKPIYRHGPPRVFICPRCFKSFPLKKMLFTTYSGSDGPPVPARYTWLHSLLKRPLRPPKPKGGKIFNKKICPDQDCRNILPVTAGTQASLVVGVIGAKFSGKTHYIAALIERLAGQVGTDFQAALVPVTDQTTERYEREFHDPLFNKGIELPVTVGDPPPLIYDLYLDGKLWKETKNRSVTLALYDTAGENFNDPDTVRQMVRYLRVASGIIFLVDPLQAPAVREKLPPSVPLPDTNQMAEPYKVISQVLTELENSKIISEDEPLSTPVAVVLTKCDVLSEAGLIDTTRLWNSNRRHIGYFNRTIHNDMDGMMGEYVMKWSQKAYNTVKARFSHKAFFGVSSTGCASDKTTRRYKYVSPWRVEDPLLWILAELGVIPDNEMLK